MLTAAPPFDIPVGADPNLAGAQPVGVCWEHDAPLTAVLLAPARPSARQHGPADSAALLGTEPTVDLGVLQSFRGSCHLPLTVDLVVTEHRYCGAGPIAAAYRATLGGLPIAAVRRVVVLLRWRITGRWPAGPGDAALAVLRMAATLTRRLAALLGAQGLRASPLSAAGLHRHADHLLGPGLVPAGALHSRDGIDVEVSPTRVGAGIASWRSFALRADTPAAAVRAVTGDAVSTTTLLRLAGPRAAPTLHGLFGVTEVAGAGRSLSAVPAGLDELAGRQDAALRTRLPVAAPPWLRLPGLPADPETLRRWRFRVGDDGPVVGATDQGRAVTLPLFSSAGRASAVIGDAQLVALLLHRCIATGAAITVRTDRAHRWSRLLDIVDDPGALALGRAAPGPPTALAEVDLLDDTPADAPADHPLTIRLVRGETTTAPPSDCTAGSALPWARVQALSADPSSIDLRIGDARFALTGVASAAERSLVEALAGGPAQSGTRAR